MLLEPRVVKRAKAADRRTILSVMLCTLLCRLYSRLLLPAPDEVVLPADDDLKDVLRPIIPPCDVMDLRAAPNGVNGCPLLLPLRPPRLNRRVLPAPGVMNPEL